MTFKWKTIVGVACIQAIMLIMIVWTALHILTTSNEAELIKRAKTTTELFASFNKDAVISYDLATVQSFVDDVLKHPGIIYTRVMRYDNVVLAQSGDENILARPFSADELPRDIRDGIFDAFAEISEGGKLFGRVEIGFSVNEIIATITSARNKIIAFACVGMILTTLFSYILGNILTRMLTQLERGSLAISRGKLGFQVDVSGNDDIAKTALAFNKMSNQLETEVREHKQAEQEKQKLENQLRQSHKMEAIGIMAGGIAHDFNNILSIILGYSEMAKEDAPPDSIYVKDLDHVLEAGHRAKDLVRQILSFSRQSQVEKIILRPQPIINESLKMLRASIPATIEIQKNISPDCGTIYADPTQLHQIVMNLCTNAFHAMEKKGGVLKVDLQVANSIPLELKEGNAEAEEVFIELSVSDTGQGIGPDIISNIFDPFFTTKTRERGTGMGLAITYGIVKEYGGTITVDSQLGMGTIFHIYLPQSKGEATQTPADKEISFEGKERILFVDDEEILANMGKDMLERLGYQVTARQSSLEALETFQNQPNEFDLVITDQTMPDMTGLDMGRRMLQIRPNIPIILCTGYSSLVNEDVAKAQGIEGFALKPLTRNAAAKLIRKILDKG